MSLGNKIRALRRRRGLTVQGLATACGLSKGFISQVENGRTSPSLSTLSDLARCLGVPAAYLFSTGEPGAFVTRAHGNGHQDGAAQSSHAVALSDRPQRTFDLYMVDIQPGESIQGQPLDDTSEQAAHVLNGFVRVAYGPDQLDLGPGDTGHWDACQGLAISNLGAEPARVVLASLNPTGESGRNGES
jgi:transcriptional regulator with XRE-family HTH domain